MKLQQIIEASQNISLPYRIADGSRFHLSGHDPADTGGYTEDHKKAAEEALENGVKALSKLQEMLYAHDRWALLLIFQAMDAAGKDSAIKHVMSGVNPQGCQVASFKSPTSTDLDHDYLWRCNIHLPERGRIGIFNRSYYEEVLVVKVHPEILRMQKIPEGLENADIWKKRYHDINCYEKYLSNNGVKIIKFFLNVSREEQKKRFLKRIDSPDKNWKFSKDDVKERNFWNAYMNAYEEMIAGTASEDAPWYVVPADHKWYTRMIVSAAIINTLNSMDISFPKIDKEKEKELQESKQELESEIN